MSGPKVLVIGYGSPIRGDDALGPLAADRLAERSLPKGVSVIARHVLTAELVADIADHDAVIFLDAGADLAPGEIRCQPLLPDASGISAMAHFLDPRELLAWCETLHGQAPDSYLVTGGGASFDYAGYALTPAAQDAVDRMLLEVDRLLSEELAAAITPAVSDLSR